MLQLALAVVLAQSQAASAVPSAVPSIDVSAARETLRVLSDGAGHFVVYDSAKPVSDMLFYGDGKVFYQLRYRGGGSSGTEMWNVTLWDPRTLDGQAWVGMRDSGKEFSVECRSRKTTLTQLIDAEAKELLAKATFLSKRWTRLPEALLRDDHGTYYFVDRLRSEDSRDRRDFRVFSGPKGKLKQLSLKDVADDSAGTVFMTKNGELRLVVNVDRSDPSAAPKRDSHWVTGKLSTDLIQLPIDDARNRTLIYTDLGVYDGQRLGTPCDDLM